MPVVSLQHDLAAIDRTLCAVSEEALPLIHLEPANSLEEHEKVAANPRHNPRFRYAPPDTENLTRWIDQLDQIELPETGVGLFFRQARDYLRTRLRLRMHLGQDAYWTEPIYALPPDRVISLARRLLSTPRPVVRHVSRPFQSNELARLFTSRLRQYRLNDWKVLTRHNISSTNTDSANRIINLRAESVYTMEEMKRLVVHEVDTHVLRAANGYNQPFHIFAVGAVPSYLMTEEGLAVVNEERMGYIDAPRTRMFAGRVLAAVRAATRPFHEVYAEQRDHGFSHDEAFTTAKRVKRGLSDTEAPGGYIKDQVYLWGRLLVEEYVLSGGDLSRLYVGKIALEHVALIHELGLRPARYIPYPYS